MKFEKHEYRKGDTVPFYPHHIINEVIMAYVMLALLVVLAFLFPAGLEERADPFNTPAHVKPE